MTLVSIRNSCNVFLFIPLRLPLPSLYNLHQEKLELGLKTTMMDGLGRADISLLMVKSNILSHRKFSKHIAHMPTPKSHNSSVFHLGKFLDCDEKIVLTQFQDQLIVNQCKLNLQWFSYFQTKTLVES